MALVVAAGLLLSAPLAQARTVSGALDEARPRSLVVDGQAYAVAPGGRIAGMFEEVGVNDLYNMTDQQLRAYPAYNPRRLRAVSRVRLLLEDEQVRVVVPLEVRK